MKNKPTARPNGNASHANIVNSENQPVSATDITAFPPNPSENLVGTTSTDTLAEITKQNVKSMRGKK